MIISKFTRVLMITFGLGMAGLPALSQAEGNEWNKGNDWNIGDSVSQAHVNEKGIDFDDVGYDVDGGDRAKVDVHDWGADLSDALADDQSSDSTDSEPLGVEYKLAGSWRLRGEFVGYKANGFDVDAATFDLSINF